MTPISRTHIYTLNLFLNICEGEKVFCRNETFFETRAVL